LGRSRRRRRRVGRGAPGKTIDFFLTDRRGSVTVFQNSRQGRARRFMRAGMALAIHAKRKGRQAIENKQVCEMAYFAPIMISTTYDQRRETARFARRKESFRFCRFFRLVEAQNARERNQRRIRGARGGVRESATRKWRRKPLESLRRTPHETFCTQPETRVDFFYFFACNPLKSPDSDEFVRDLRNIKDLSGR
jgi:hypothetical protein